MRFAELVMAVVMAGLSVFLMWKSTELPIGWVRGEGPGGGAFPFWLSLGMLISCIAVVVLWYRKSSPPSRSTAPFMDRRTVKSFLLVGGSLTAMVALIHGVGVYVAVPLFLAFNMRVLGRHGWAAIGALAVGMPVFSFLLF